MLLYRIEYGVHSAVVTCSQESQGLDCRRPSRAPVFCLPLGLASYTHRPGLTSAHVRCHSRNSRLSVLFFSLCRDDALACWLAFYTYLYTTWSSQARSRIVSLCSAPMVSGPPRPLAPSRLFFQARSRIHIPVGRRAIDAHFPAWYRYLLSPFGGGGTSSTAYFPSNSA